MKTRNFLYELLILIFCNSFLNAAVFYVSNVSDAGAGSLRQAILDANANAGADSIKFNISGTGPFLINVSTALASLTDASGGTVMDGYSQTGSIINSNSSGGLNSLPLIILSSTGGITTGLNLISNNNIIRGIVIGAFSGSGIRIKGSGNKILGCIIGLDPAGSIPFSSTSFGIYLSDSSSGDSIGDGTAPGRNLISGNISCGVYVSGRKNTILGNIIGLQKNGASYVVSNLQEYGIQMVDADSCFVGGDEISERNIISGNEKAGILMTSSGGSKGTMLCEISGNYIGPAADGETIVTGSTQNTGIHVSGSTGNNTIGGYYAARGNLISGNSDGANGGVGIFADGVLLPSYSINMVVGNLIGPGANGNTELANNPQNTGVHLVTYTLAVGFKISNYKNVISGNRTYGVYVANPLSLIGSMGAPIVAGSYIGIGADGYTVLGDQDYGIFLDSIGPPVMSGTIGGSGDTTCIDYYGRNVISGNSYCGIAMIGQNDLNNVPVYGNYIGTAADGMSVPAGSSQDVGIYISNCIGQWIGASDCYIGQRGNLISGNLQKGIWLTGSGTREWYVQANRIGTDVTGAAKLANSTQQYGIYMDDGAGNAGWNVCGYIWYDDENLIAFNEKDGVYIEGTNTEHNVFLRNSIFSNGTGYKAINLNGNGNDNQPAPAITAASYTTVIGTGIPGNMVQLYKNITGNCQDAVTFLGETTVWGGGSWTITGLSLTSADYVTANQFDQNLYNSSEFSCIGVKDTFITATDNYPQKENSVLKLLLGIQGTEITVPFSGNEIVRVSLYNILGEIIATFPSSGITERFEVRANLSGLSNGIYFCRILSRSGDKIFSNTGKFYYCK